MCHNVCACVRAYVCVSARMLLCPPVCMFAQDCAGAWQQDQFEPGKTLTVKQGSSHEFWKEYAENCGGAGAVPPGKFLIFEVTQPHFFVIS